MKSTKKSIISAIVVIAICFTMLVGGTFAWFTDSSSVGIQAITTGTLDLKIVDENDDSLEGKMLIWDAFDGRDQDEIFWEPGATYETNEFYIVNNGNLGFKFKIALDEFTGDTELLDVLTFDIIADASQFTFNTGAVMTTASGEFDLLEGVQVDTFIYGEYFFEEYTVAPGAKIGPLTVKAHMAESAGNEYMGMSLESIGFTVLATQATGEQDSYDGVYDGLATYPGKAYVVEAEETVSPDAEGKFEIANDTNTVKMSGTATSGATQITGTVKEIEEPETAVPTQTLTQIKSAGKELVTYDIKVDGNEGDVAIEIYLGVNLSNVEVYHVENGSATLIPCEYDAKTGYATFKSATFSPFAIAYHTPSYVTEESTFRALLAENSTGSDILLGANIQSTQTQTNGYGKTNFVVNGVVLDGNEKTINSKSGCWNTWDSVIFTNGGTIKNLTVSGAMRGIFTGGTVSDLFIENVIFDNVIYTFNSDGGNKEYGVYLTDCIMSGWTSYSNVHKEVVFTDCEFTEGSGYAFLRAYNNTEFKNCKFDKDAEFEVEVVAGAVATFENCYYGDTLITASNIASLGLLYNTDVSLVKVK